jgi:hypothetical protein
MIAVISTLVKLIPKADKHTGNMEDLEEAI